MKRLINIVVTTFFYTYAVAIELPYRILDGDYYIVALIIIIAILDISVASSRRNARVIDEIIRQLNRSSQSYGKVK